MKPTPAEIENGRPRSASDEDAADGRERHVQVDERGRPQRAEGEVEHREDQGQRQRDDDRQPPAGRLQVLELPAPADVVARRQLDLAADPLLRLGHERRHVAAAHVQLDHDPAPHRLARDLGRPGLERRCPRAGPGARAPRRARPPARCRGRRSSARSRRRSGPRARSGAGPRTRCRRSCPRARPRPCRARPRPRCRSGRSGHGRP